MSRLRFAALLLTACAAEVAPRAEPGDPRLLPVGATAALDGSFSEGDGLSYAWTVEPEGATILDAESPFATLIAEAPGFYTLSLEVCDAGGRCDIAETWARVDAPGSAAKFSDWAPDEFASATSGAGGPLGVTASKKCSDCKKAAAGDEEDWTKFCNKIAPGQDRDSRIETAKCFDHSLQSESNKTNYWYGAYC